MVRTITRKGLEGYLGSEVILDGSVGILLWDRVHDELFVDRRTRYGGSAKLKKLPIKNKSTIQLLAQNISKNYPLNHHIESQNHYRTYQISLK